MATIEITIPNGSVDRIKSAYLKQEQRRDETIESLTNEEILELVQNDMLEVVRSKVKKIERRAAIENAQSELSNSDIFTGE